MSEFAGMMGIFGDGAPEPAAGDADEERGRDAEQLLREADEVEVEDSDDSFIEIVEYE